MSFRNNGRKRDPKFVFGSIFMLIVGLLCLLLASSTDRSEAAWKTISIVVILLSLFMFKNANEQ